MFTLKSQISKQKGLTKQIFHKENESFTRCLPPFCIKQLMTMKSADMFRTTAHWSVPKIMPMAN